MYIKSNFACVASTIKKLEGRDLSLNESINIVNGLKDEETVVRLEKSFPAY